MQQNLKAIMCVRCRLSCIHLQKFLCREKSHPRGWKAISFPSYQGIALKAHPISTICFCKLSAFNTYLLYPSTLSQITSFGGPGSCQTRTICFTYSNVYVSVLFSQIRGRWGGSGWRGHMYTYGIHVYLWLIHTDVWWKPSQYCKVIILPSK